MDLNHACAALEEAFAVRMIPPEIQERLVRLVRCEDPGGLPTPYGPNVACPHCRRPVSLTVDPVVFPTLQAQRMASVTLLYGTSPAYFLGALVLGQNLEKYSKKEKVLLYTADVPLGYLDVLKLYWDCRKVDPLRASKALFSDYDRSRFHNIFTKFQCLALFEYSKVLMLDNDLLIRENIDHLFNLAAPAAMRRHGGSQSRPLEHGEQYTASDLWRSLDRGGCQSNGLNAGVVLLEPNEMVYNRMIEEVRGEHVEHCGTLGPEQDYWSRFYTTFLNGTISHIHCQYNYQVGLQDDYTSDAYKEQTSDSVYIVHYSGRRCKPWELPVQDLLHNDQAIREKFPVEAGDNAPRCLSKDVVDFIWEWIMDLRLVANIVKLRNNTLPQIIDDAAQQLVAASQNADVPEDDHATLLTALGPSWALPDAKRQRWIIKASSRSWLEFRPGGILWTEHGTVGHWSRSKDDELQVRIGQLGINPVALTVTDQVSVEGGTKKFTGPSCEGWPLEALVRPCTPNDDDDGWLSDSGKANGKAVVKANGKAGWTTMNYQMPGSKGFTIRTNFCHASTVIHDIGIGAELQGYVPFSANPERGKGKGNRPSSIHVGRIETKNGGNQFLPWRGHIDGKTLDAVRGDSVYYAVRVTPRDEHVPTRWFVCTLTHGSEYRVVPNRGIEGAGTPLSRVFPPTVRLSAGFAKAVLEGSKS